MPKSEAPKKRRKLSINGPTSQERRWQQLLEKWRVSGLPGTAFCRRRRLKESAFRFWQKEVPYRERRRRERAEALGRPAAGQTFIEAHLVGAGVSSAAPFEVVVSGGRTVRLAGDFDPAVLRKLVTTLEGDR